MGRHSLMYISNAYDETFSCYLPSGDACEMTDKLFESEE